MIKVFLNGQETEVPEGLNVTTLLEWLKLPADRVAVERNLVIVPREQWARTSIETGDRFEVVHFVGGGCAPATSLRRLPPCPKLTFEKAEPGRVARRTAPSDRRGRLCSSERT